MKDNWNPATSGSLADYRIQWAGKLFKLISPGTAGTGLKVNFDGGDMTDSYPFPDNFVMAGS